jgi:hypothetical protein
VPVTDMPSGSPDSSNGSQTTDSGSSSY